MLLLAVCLGPAFLLAQRTISGTVTDAETGETLIGANILVVGTSTGTITDFDGTYSLMVPEGATQLQFSYTGYSS
ncbi:MAG: carboxypeptidase-like regulatory domain-containing protein, partial [Lewinella sp.]|nr:carboxypeptidase-like regulatory domain-containing protein [Lewinella sp.]